MYFLGVENPLRKNDAAVSLSLLSLGYDEENEGGVDTYGDEFSRENLVNSVGILVNESGGNSMPDVSVDSVDSVESVKEKGPEGREVRVVELFLGLLVMLTAFSS